MLRDPRSNLHQWALLYCQPLSHGRGIQTFEFVRRIGSILRCKSVRLIDRVALFLFLLETGCGAFSPAQQTWKRQRAGHTPPHTPAHTSPQTHPSTQTLTNTDLDIKHRQTTRRMRRGNRKMWSNAHGILRTACRWVVMADRTSNHALFYCFRHMVTEATRSDRRKGRNNCMRELFTFASTGDMNDAVCFRGSQQGGRSDVRAIDFSATTVHVASWACRVSLIVSRCHCFEMSLPTTPLSFLVSD